MHILFLDESGTPPKPNATQTRYFVLGGLIVPENAWHRVHDAVMGMKIRRRLRGELKWRYFASTNEDEKNPLRRLSAAERDEVRSELYAIIRAETSLRIIACVCSSEAAYALPSITDQSDIYHLTYKSISERFQYYLQDITRSLGGRTEYGIIVSDHRGLQDDMRLRKHHQMLFYSTGRNTTQYKNLIEGLFLTPSHFSVGIQLADLVAGAVWRKFERGDDKWYAQIEASLRRNAKGTVDGYGLVRVPKAGWK